MQGRLCKKDCARETCKETVQGDCAKTPARAYPLNPPYQGDFSLNSPLIRGARGVKNDERWVSCTVSFAGTTNVGFLAQSRGQDTYRTSFCIGDYEKAFTLIIQRTAVIGQMSLDLDSLDSSYRISSGEISSGGYIDRAIAINRPLIGMGLAIARLSTAHMTNMTTWRGQREQNQGTEAGFWRHLAMFRFCCFRGVVPTLR